jgi:putative SOS response-associated peptidase YedK
LDQIVDPVDVDRLKADGSGHRGETIRSCTVITCAVNEVLGELHDRMPVILAEKDWPKRLGEEPATSDELKALLVPAPLR